MKKEAIKLIDKKLELYREEEKRLWCTPWNEEIHEKIHLILDFRNDLLEIRNFLLKEVKENGNTL